MITACASAIAFYAVISDVADADPLVNLMKVVFLYPLMSPTIFIVHCHSMHSILSS